jgi:lipoprotein-anchoring transpeptidase ErfK/SrfK
MRLNRRSVLLGAAFAALTGRRTWAQQLPRHPSQRYDPGHDRYLDDPDWQEPGWQEPGWQEPGWQEPGWQDSEWQDSEWQIPEGQGSIREGNGAEYEIGQGPLRRPLPEPPGARGLYGPALGERFPVPALNLAVVRPEYLRRRVPYAGAEPAGVIVVDPAAHYLYLVFGDGSAMRYGVGVGRAGFGWSGSAYIRDKREWPDWYPPREMLERQPELRARMQQLPGGVGMAGGPGNPLGARALYLWQGNRDTLYRLHGTVEPWTIGKSVSSGCIRMINQDVIDLYERVEPGTPVIVLSRNGPPRARNFQDDRGIGSLR